MLLSPILTLDPAKVDVDLAFLMGCLRDVLEEAGEQALASRLPWIGTAPSDADAISLERLSQSYSIAFHLLSMVEQNAAVQQHRLTEDGSGEVDAVPPTGPIGRARVCAAKQEPAAEGRSHARARRR